MPCAAGGDAQGVAQSWALQLTLLSVEGADTDWEIRIQR